LLAAQGIPVFCPDLAQKWLTFFVVLCFVLVTIVLNGKPQRSQLLAGTAVLNLTGNGIEPMLQAAVEDNSSATARWNNGKMPLPVNCKNAPPSNSYNTCGMQLNTTTLSTTNNILIPSFRS
jgi:hypothetical protein